MDINVLLVGSNPIFLKGILTVLHEEGIKTVIGEAKNGQEAISLIKLRQPDIVVIDIKMPHMNDIESIKCILGENQSTKILALSDYSDDGLVNELLELGTKGLLLRSTTQGELIQAINKVVNGEIYFSSTNIHNTLDKDNEAFDNLNILQTKLHRPPVTDDYIIRKKIIEHLESNISKPLSLMVAPAGYGKSIIVSQWLERTRARYAWFSIDEEHNTLRLFLSYVFVAIQKIFPGSLEQLAHMMQAYELPPLKTISNYLINDLDKISDEFILVLDDFHNIHEKSILKLIAELLRFPPENMQLSILSRRDPSISLSSLRTQGRIVEIRTKELCFSESEIALLFKRLLKFDLDWDITKELLEKTEGWVVGLRLASLTFNVKENAVSELGNVKVDSPLVAEYLIGELLSKQSIEIQECLLLSSILNRFCPELLDVICSSVYKEKSRESTGLKFLKYLISANLFVIPLDDENKWFRYHHLFQNLLQQELKKQKSTDHINKLHRSVGLWFEKNNYLDEALQHFLYAGDTSHAIRLIDHNRYNLMNNEKWYKLELWLNMFPPEIIKKNVILLSTQAYLFEFLGEFYKAFENIGQAKQLLNNHNLSASIRKKIRGEVSTLEMEQHIILGDGEKGIQCGKKALQLLPAVAHHILSYSIGFQVAGYQMIGKMEEGIRILDETNKKLSLPPGIIQARFKTFLSGIYWMEGDLEAVKTAAYQCLRIGEDFRLPESITFARYFLGIYHYCRNNLVQSEKYLMAIINDDYFVRPTYLVNSTFVMALLYKSKGRKKKLVQSIKKLLDRIRETSYKDSFSLIQAIQVELAIRHNELDRAEEQAKEATFSQFPPAWYFYVPQLTPIKLMLLQNTNKSLQKAMEQLNELDTYLNKINRNTIRIEVLALKALIFKAQNNETVALKMLMELLSLAEPGGNIRTFVDFGNPMNELLKLYRKTSGENLYVDELLKAFEEETPSEDNILEKEDMALSNEKAESFNALTPREIEVINQVTAGLKNKEISENLFVSDETVKKHLSNIFRKLKVTNRIELVNEVREMNIT